MITEAEINRINALARKSKTPQGLTPAEKEEQTALRQKYIASVKENLAAQLDSVVVQEPDGTRHKLKPKDHGPKTSGQ